MTTSLKTIYSTTVKEIGAEAKEFKEINMLILFGEEAPEALRPSCYIIEVNQTTEPITAGMHLKIDDEDYRITAVGNEVNTNFNNLGHTAIVLNSADHAELAGSLYVEQKEYPDIHVGSKISITKEN